MKLFITPWIAHKYKTICFSILLLLPNISKACGPDFSGYYFTWLLEHYTYNNKFFDYQFDSENRFYSKSYLWDENDSYIIDPAKYNVDAWRKYLQLPNAIADSTIKQYFYTNLNNADRKKSNHAISTAITQKKNQSEIWEYLQLLNEYQTKIVQEDGDWSYTKYTDITVKENVKQFTDKCEKALQQSKDEFVQWRLLYVMQRAAHFNAHHQLANDLFEKYYPTITKNNAIEQYWCEGMQAGALLRLQQQDKAIYYAARAFANSPDQYKQAMCTYLFTNRNWKSALPFCKTAKDSVYVTLLEGANHPLPNMEFIEQVYNTNPAAEELKLLWLRETNKLEQYVLNATANDLGNYYFNSEEPINIDSIYKTQNVLVSYTKLAEKMMSNPMDLPVKTTIGNCFAFYFYQLKDYAKASYFLNQIAKMPKDEIEQQQYDLLTKLTTLKQSNNFQPQEFIPLLNQFAKYSPTEFNYNIGYYLVYNELAPYCMQTKDSSAAFWAYVYANSRNNSPFDIYGQDASPEGWNSFNYATYLVNHSFNIAQVEALQKQWTAKKGNSAIETYCIKNSSFIENEKFFALIIARKYMLTQQWNKALENFSNLPKDYLATMGPNPANLKINDTINDTEYQATKNTFTVKQIVELAQKLKTNADKSEATFANDKLLYATLLYNLSFYGKNHYILDNHWNHYGTRLTAYFKYDSVDAHAYYNGKDNYAMPMHTSYQNYFYLYTAEQYAKKALLDLSSGEDKAKCVYLLSKCWQKRCPLKMQKTEYGYLENVSDYYAYSLKNPYFKELATQYKNTRWQEQVFNSCAYYQDFRRK